MLRIPRVHTAFIYLTERCNLGCRYCYFRNKKQRDLDWTVIERFLSLLGKSCGVPQNFEISGGEPLLRWETVRRLGLTLRSRFPRVNVGLQTNGLLLTADKAAFIKQHGLMLEIGIDGDMGVTTRWRRRMGEDGFRRLVRNIRACVKLGIPVSCTMTVHPKETRRLVKSFEFLRSLGISEIDVTPAAFMSWDTEAQKIFKENYRALLHSSRGRAEVFMFEDVDRMAPGELDLSLHPPGQLLCGDPYLCLPDREKEKHSLWDPSTGVLDGKSVAWFQKKYRSISGKKAAIYRDHVCAGFRIVNQIMGRRYMNTDEIIPLMRFLSKAHVSFS